MVTRSYDAIAAGCVSVTTPAIKGYDITLVCDLSKIENEKQGEVFSSKVATLRSLVQVRTPASQSDVALQSDVAPR